MGKNVARSDVPLVQIFVSRILGAFLSSTLVGRFVIFDNELRHFYPLGVRLFKNPKTDYELIEDYTNSYLYRTSQLSCRE